MQHQVDQGSKPVAVLLAKSAIAAAAHTDMAGAVQRLEAGGQVAKAVYAFSEQGQPALRSVLRALRDEGHEQIVILPMLAPMEPAFHNWIARTIQRWRVAEPEGRFPAIRVGKGLGQTEAIGAALVEMLESAAAAAPTPENPKVAIEGVVVSDRKHRVLVCMGGPCNQAGAAVVWGHLRNVQVATGLADAEPGMRSAKASCLGPCALAPVVQVYPEGVFYGGVDEAGIDRIIDEHLRQGRVVEDLAYLPSEGKQRLREPT